MAQILDGKIVRDKIANDLRSTISDLRSPPKLVIIQVGDNPESNTYIRQKVLFGQKIGAIVDHQKLPEDTPQENLNSTIHNLNSDSSVNGIIVQLPIPPNLDKDKIINSIDPKKDVDGQTASNIKLLLEGTVSRHPGVATTPIGSSEPITKTVDSIGPSGLQNDSKTSIGFTPATTRGIFTLLDYYKITVSGKHVVVVGRSSLVGKPTALLALNKNATVTVCHSKTENLPAVTKTADILIVATGKPKLITKDYVSENQVVIDVGINVIARSETTKQSDEEIASLSASGRIARNDGEVKPESEPEKQKLVGDVDFESVSKIVSAISPVPGGIGPMTVASLFQNLMEAYKRQI